MTKNLQNRQIVPLVTGFDFLSRTSTG